jgi:hypothetical protein
MNVIIPLAASLIFTFVLLFLIKSFVQGRQKKLMESISREIAVESGSILIQPESGSFRGSTQKYGKVKCDGVIYLTTERIVFRPLMGKNIIKLNLFEIQNISIEKAFLGQWRAGMKVMVLHLTDSTQIGFYVKDHNNWKQDIETTKK